MAYGGSATVGHYQQPQWYNHLVKAQGRALVHAQAALDGDAARLAPSLLQCPWAGDRVVAGGCNVKTGVGRISTPICTNQAGEQVLCDGVGPTPSGWACSAGDTTGTTPIEAVAVCCAASLPTSFTFNFDDVATPIDGFAGPVPSTYRGFEWSNSAWVFNGPAVAAFYGQCINGYTNGITSQPNVLYTRFSVPVSMSALPGLVFTVSTLQVTAAWANNVVATFTGFNSEGATVGTVSVTVDQSGPTLADLTSLGRISTLVMTTSTCGEDALGSCGTAAFNCNDPGTQTYLAIDDVVVTGEYCHVQRGGQTTALLLEQDTPLHPHLLTHCLSSPIADGLVLCPTLLQFTLRQVPAMPGGLPVWNSHPGCPTTHTAWTLVAWASMPTRIPWGSLPQWTTTTEGPLLTCAAANTHNTHTTIEAATTA
jgi:hypothetical protein